MVYPARYRDHPRMCGEKKSFANSIEMELGSPPHVRGKEHKEEIWKQGYRITPACAGKRAQRRNLETRLQDHPRMCGEKGFLATFSCKLLGSPPHVRGKGRFCFHQSMRNRITPACAGKRCNRVCLCCCNQDHPRMCGEKIPLLHFQLAAVGSPPHVRGKD